MENKKTLLFLGGIFVVWLVIQVRHEKPDPRIVSLDDTNFQSTIPGQPLALVEFGAPWCGPCRQVQPALNKLVDQYGTSVQFYQVNIDEAPSLAAQFAASGIPLVVLFEDGIEQSALLGARPYDEYRELILKHLPDSLPADQKDAKDIPHP